jgi:hypothetical protein
MQDQLFSGFSVFVDVYSIPPLPGVQGLYCSTVFPTGIRNLCPEIVLLEFIDVKVT